MKKTMTALIVAAGLVLGGGVAVSATAAPVTSEAAYCTFPKPKTPCKPKPGSLKFVTPGKTFRV